MNYFCAPSGNKHQNNPLVSTQAVRHSSAYIILYENNMLWVKYYD